MTSSSSPRPKRKMSLPSRKNVRFSSKEQRKARQVGAAGIDFRLREIRVHRQRREQVRAQPLRDVEARMELAIDARRRARECRRPR